MPTKCGEVISELKPPNICHSNNCSDANIYVFSFLTVTRTTHVSGCVLGVLCVGLQHLWTEQDAGG